MNAANPPLAPALEIISLAKSFVLHHQAGTRLDVLDGVSLTVAPGECVALNGPSGAGKSTLLRTIYANYTPSAGQVLVRHGERVIDMSRASPRLVLDIRRRTMGYVSQFLRVIPRVATLDIVAEPLRNLGIGPAEARERAATVLARLNVPRGLWPLAPATFSGGEQQRVNLARGFVAGLPILLLDEPTASLDAANAEAAMSLAEEARAGGAAIVGIFHDGDVRRRLATRIFDMGTARAMAA